MLINTFHDTSLFYTTQKHEKKSFSSKGVEKNH